MTDLAPPTAQSVCPGCGAVMSAGAWIFMLSVFAGGYGLAWFVRRQWQP